MKKEVFLCIRKADETVSLLLHLNLLLTLGLQGEIKKKMRSKKKRARRSLHLRVRSPFPTPLCRHRRDACDLVAFHHEEKAFDWRPRLCGDFGGLAYF